jgi:AmmeMemoRadiSam system protein B
MPSPYDDRPGLLIRDPMKYSDVAMILPPLLIECLACFDGEQTDLDLRKRLVSLTGDLKVGEAGQNLIDSLQRAGFLDDEVHADLRARKHREFVESLFREASHAGNAYPAGPENLRAELAACLDQARPVARPKEMAGLAAPHLSFEGARACYGAAYNLLRPGDEDRTFVVLGTSHYGRPDSFGLTRKPFRTPLGETRAALELVEELERRGGETVVKEDYCHAIEHSIEFQVLFLQQVLGPGVRVLPILCGPYASSLQTGCAPEDDPGVSRFLDSLRELAAREGPRLMWVLGIDLSHVGRRYGDPFSVQAGPGPMERVKVMDRRRLELVEAGDAAGFWGQLQETADTLHWCGASALYTLLRVLPGVVGELLRYQQWNIDEDSVVSCAALAFHRPVSQVLKTEK